MKDNEKVSTISREEATDEDGNFSFAKTTEKVMEDQKEGLDRLAREQPRQDKMVKEVMGEKHLNEIKEMIDEQDQNRDFGNRPKLACEDLQPRESKMLGNGDNRCVFEKDGKIVKVARDTDGRVENRGARAVMENVDENVDAFAMPEAVDDSDTVMITEKAESTQSDGKGVPLMGEDLFTQVDQKLGEAYQEDGVHCKDIGYDDIGVIEGKGAVLVDLGGCSEV